MSCIIWNFLNNFLVFENRSEYFWNNCNWNVSNIFNLNSFNFSIDFWYNWFRFLNLFHLCWFHWNICFILYLDRLYCFIFDWNKEVTINTNYWIFRWDLLNWHEYFLGFFWNNISWDISYWTNFKCAYSSWFSWSNRFQLIKFMCRSSVDWNIFSSINCNWINSFILNRNKVLIINFDFMSNIIWLYW